MITAKASQLIKIKSQGNSKWIIHKAQYLLRFCKWGRKLSGLDCGENSTVKHAWDRSPGMGDLPRSPGYQVQTLEVMIDAKRFISLVSILLLRPCEHHPMQWVLSGFKLQYHEKFGHIDWCSWDMGHALMNYSTQIIPKYDI